MFNLITAIITAIIDIAEPAIEDDDTTQFQPVAFTPEPPVLRTHLITTAALIDTSALCGCLVAYRLDSGCDWQIGNILAIEETRFGIKALFQPKNADLASKWRFLNELNYAWME